MNQTDKLAPTHLGIILDGNRRWARDRGLTLIEGHRAGYKALERVTEAAFKAGIKYVTAYVFSTENWNRAEEEVEYLMKLALRVFKQDLNKLHKKDIRVRWLGTREKLSDKHIEAINKAVEKTKNNKSGDLCFCFNYGGQHEIIDAFKSYVREGNSANDLNINNFKNYLYEPDVPDVDIMVRSSGERRISNFMLWRMAYAELMFIDKHWPDFTADDVDNIIEEFNNRQRRFGT